MTFHRLFTWLLFAVLPLTLPASADDWVEYSTPRFQLYADISSTMAEEWVAKMDAFAQLVPAPLRQDDARQYKIIVINNYGLFQKIKPHQASKGFSFRQADTTYLIVGRNIRPYAPHQHQQVILNLFTRPYLNWRLIDYPLWFSQGANFLFSSAVIDGDRANFPNYIGESFARIPASQSITIADLMFDTNAIKNPAYVSHSYAYVHYLLFGSINGYPDYRDKLSLYLASEVKTQASFEQFMGQSLAALNDNYKKYTQETGLKDASIKLAVDAKNIQQRQLSNDESHYLIAGLLYHHNQFDYAQKYVNKINKASPLYAELQQQYLAYNAEKKALNEAEKTLKKDPKNLALLTFTANAYWNKAKNTSQNTERDFLVNKAIERAQRALVIDPDIKAMHVILRFAYSSSGQHDKAFHHIKEHLRLEPKDAAINYIVGRRYLEQNNYEQARIYLNKACQLDDKKCELIALKLTEIDKREAEKKL